MILIQLSDPVAGALDPTDPLEPGALRRCKVSTKLWRAWSAALGVTPRLTSAGIKGLEKTSQGKRSSLSRLN